MKETIMYPFQFYILSWSNLFEFNRLDKKVVLANKMFVVYYDNSFSDFFYKISLPEKRKTLFKTG